MAHAVTMEILQLLEDKLGKEEGRKIAEAIEIGLEAIEKRAEAVAIQKKIELKDELTKELITKAEFYGETKLLRQEMQTLRQEMQTIKVELEGKIDGIKKELEGKIDGVKKELEGKIDGIKKELEGKIDVVKTDIEGKIENEILQVDRKFTIMFIILLFTIVFLNQNALEFIVRIFGLLK